MRRVIVPARVSPKPPALGGVLHRLEGRTMGSTWSVALVGSHDCALATLQNGIQAELDAVVAEMSPWETDSALTRFNRAEAGRWHVLPPALFKVLSYALEVAEQSAGAVDPSLGALVDAWGFGPARRHTEAGFAPPSPEVLASALACSGWQRLQVDVPSRRVRQPGGLRLDLSAVAKGFGVDQVLRYLQGQGIRHCLVEVGGELRGEGVKPDGQPWWVALEAPPAWGDAAPLSNETVVALHGLAVATSGDYRRGFELDGTRHSHTIDPRDGLPIRHGLASVTVWHRECMAADALSTALNVMGVEPGLAFANERGLVALFIVRCDGGFEEHISEPLAALLQ